MRLFREVISRGGDHPVALNALGVHALSEGRHGDAAGLFSRAVVLDPRAPDLWLNLARAARAQGLNDRERKALAAALEIDQRHFMARVRMAELLERIGDEAGAVTHWSGVLAMADEIEERTPALEAMLDHASAAVARHHDDFAAAIDGGLAGLLEPLGSSETRRFKAAVDHALGRRPIFANECAGLHFPFLPADEFFDRAHFPWMEQIEAKTDEIRAELDMLLADDGAGFAPYIAMEPGTPANKWTPLDHKMDWGALHLWKDGKRNDAACARAPKTAAAVEALPLSDLPGRTPTVFFSLLKPGAHLPAHTGVSNVRTIIHLPLIVPPDCGFRVGGETREWVEGEAWAFDDTIEHEAWNRSDRLRAILIFDVWNPYIRETERALLRRFYDVALAAGQSGNKALDLSE
ncbi:aspartyl/asparaginyl beta-hydroxylase domain-containing protein [Sphingomonas sp. AP4-R1]|uniref:aspartyl/asparaginyl beta-hydroxylase domain-containing protein n=1 Tax=Sphingomonas sp. AP4-R1 TaxID=2735134 RepID=UPI0020A4E060|nr:aspartyl/asparaginyl beta-hydroxylase domain-containing protein [Sphingomonas sp. AP4-R1]